MAHDMGFEDFQAVVTLAHQPAKDLAVREQLTLVEAGLLAALCWISSGNEALAKVAISEARLRVAQLARRVRE